MTKNNQTLQICYRLQDKNIIEYEGKGVRMLMGI